MEKLIGTGRCDSWEREKENRGEKWELGEREGRYLERLEREIPDKNSNL